jgi:hypothetical protein
MSTRHRTGFGRKQSTLLATPSTGSTFIESSRKHRMNSSQVKSLMFHILESLRANALFLSKEVENLNVGDLFSNAMNQEQGNTMMLNIKYPSSAEA